MGGRVCCGTRQDKKGSNQWVDVSVVALGRISHKGGFSYVRKLAHRNTYVTRIIYTLTVCSNIFFTRAS